MKPFESVNPSCLPLLLASWFCFLISTAQHGVAAEAGKPVRVFILAGQSNMKGNAKVSLLDYQAGQPATQALFAKYRAGGKWAKRNDVWIKFLDRSGKLTVGFGSPKCIGPELAFGWAMGDHYSEPVLLIKTAWGGHSLWCDFRPPSAGLPPESSLQTMLADQQKRNAKITRDDVVKSFGASYRAMVDDVNQTLAKLGKFVPGAGRAKAGPGYELAGFFWFQGWNDMLTREYTAEYATNMIHFIRDVRRDLRAPTLPFVIAQMGVEGTNASKNIATLKAAQAAAAVAPGFEGNVALVKTDVFWDYEADAVFKKGWRENLEEWNRVGSDYPYHYLGSGRTLCAIGNACAEALLNLKEHRENR